MKLDQLFARYMKEKKSDDHATLSASGAERWLNCPGSVALSKGIPSTDSPASIRGTNTHTLLQFILENENWEKLLKTSHGQKFLISLEYDGNMLKSALFAANFVWETKRAMRRKHGKEPVMMTEAKVHLESVGYGTADVILYHPYDLLWVMDYKNGTKAVEPEENWQGLYYGHAAADLFNWEFAEVPITIIQPNAPHSKGHVRTWKVDERTLMHAGNKLRSGAAATKKKNAPLVKNDSWCWFCPARQICPLHVEEKTKKLIERFHASS